ncbi:MAG: alpha/beta hydrolase [Pseudomonadota bacterium]
MTTHSPSNPGRRQALAVGSAALAGAGLPAVHATGKSYTFVLVPGTWHGGWVWQPTARELRRRGHRAYAVTCTGVGERSHLMSPDIGLETHVQDVANVLRFEELENVVLVGHSFAGLTVTGVADAMGDRIARIVFYDAFVPTRERPAWVMRDEAGNWPEWWVDRQSRFVDGYQMAFDKEYPIEMLLDPKTHPQLAQSVASRLTNHPSRQWTEPVSFSNGGWESFPCAYIHCVGQKYRQSSAAMWQPARDQQWPFIELDGPRLAMLTQSAQVSDVLENLAAG